MFDTSINPSDEPKEWVPIALADIKSLRDYTMALIIDPKLSSTARHYEKWGLDQWLIREKKQSFVAMMQVNKGAYIKFMLKREIEQHGSLIAFLNGKPMVQTTVYRRGIYLFMQDIAKNSIGVVLSETATDRWIYFPASGHMMATPHVAEYPRSDTNFVECGVFTEAAFETLVKGNTYPTMFGANVFYQNDTTGEVVYVKKTYPAMRNSAGDGYICSVVPTRTKKGKRGYVAEKVQPQSREMNFNHWKCVN